MNIVPLKQAFACGRLLHMWGQGYTRVIFHFSRFPRAKAVDRSMVFSCLHYETFSGRRWTHYCSVCFWWQPTVWETVFWRRFTILTYDFKGNYFVSSVRWKFESCRQFCSEPILISDDKKNSLLHSATMIKESIVAACNNRVVFVAVLCR